MKAFTPAGFFALRTPLLPFEELLSWGEGLEAPTALDDPVRLEEMLAHDRLRLRARLHEMASRAEVREALFVASPHLDETFEVWVREPDSDRGQGIERALCRYLARMAGRATPFGLCAGCSVGVLGDETHLVLEDRSKYRRHTRLGMGYLCALTESLQRDSGLRKAFNYRPNSSLYRAARSVRYIASRQTDKERTFHLVVVEDSDSLTATLHRAERGASVETLAAALVDDDVTLAEAEAYIDELIESQILVAEIPLPVSGREPIHPLVEALRQRRETAPIAERLAQVGAELEAMDATGLGVAPARYRTAARMLEGLPAASVLSRTFQVDLVKPARHATLGKTVLAEIAQGIELLHRLSSPAPDPELARFCEAFSQRYDARDVPLLEALDEEAGIGFGTGLDATPLLQGLHFPPDKDESAPWGVREKFLMWKLSEALQSGAHEMTLSRDDLEKLATTTPPPLPAAFAVMATIAATSDTAVAQGDFRLLFGFANGPSGARLLGRFCHADEALRQHVERHLRAEEALQPEAVFAEIVHLPEGHFGNFICRPALREYEIPYLGCPGVASDRQVILTDLSVTVRGPRVILSSARLGREIIPRMSNAHNSTLSSLGVYRFLCALQDQRVAASLTWKWGALDAAPFLPRVSAGRLVLCPAQWRISKEELQRLGALRGTALYRAVQSWRAGRRLPQWVTVADGDNLLPIDLDNVLSVETFVHLVRSREKATVRELFPPPNQLCAHGPEGRFVHEIVAPFARTSDAAKAVRPVDLAHSIPSSPRLTSRIFPPGSEWLFAKIYTSTATADGLLRQVIAPLVRAVLSSGAADRWFFIRYGDPAWHLRVRFRGPPDRLHAEVLPALQAAVRPWLDDGRLWRFQLDTYEREVERYGGAEGIVLAERFFQADSEAVLKILELLEPGDEGSDERWRLTLRGSDVLLSDFGFDLPSKCRLFQQRAKFLAATLRGDKRLESELSEKFRKERQVLEQLMDPAGDEDSPLSAGFDILRQRSERMAPIVAELKACEQTGRLAFPLEDIVMDCVHMHANRLLCSGGREQEAVIYDFLSRLCRSQLARARHH